VRDLPFPLLLALRYLKSTRRDAFASFLSAVAAIGIALGVAALILSLAALSGFQALVKGEVLARTPQVAVELPADADAAAALAAARGVRGVTGGGLVVRGRGWLVAGPGARPVEIVGFAEAVPATFPGAAGAPEGLYLDGGLAAAWGLAPGRTATVVSPRPTLTPFGPQPRARTLPVAGVFEEPRTQEERARIALPLSIAEGLLGRPARRLELTTAGLDEAARVARRLPAVLPAGSRIETWREINRPLFFVLGLEKAMTFVAVALIVLVAALALVADLALVIASKRAEIGMLGAMGATPAALARAFLLLGAMLAGIGLAAGIALGAGGAAVLDRYELIALPGQVYIFDHVPFVVRGGDVAAVAGLTLALALGFSLYAARRAAAIDPVAALSGAAR
jgi:lipoprotein-releasing system permease protein